VVVEKAAEVHLPDARAAELALVEDRQQERREERDRRVPEIDRPHLAAGDVQRQALLDRGEQRLERGLEIAGPDARIVQALGKPHHMGPDPSHVLQAECRAVQHPPDGVFERVLGRRDERPVQRCCLCCLCGSFLSPLAPPPPFPPPGRLYSSLAPSGSAFDLVRARPLATRNPRLISREVQAHLQIRAAHAFVIGRGMDSA